MSASTVFVPGSRQISRLPAEVKTRLDTVIEKGFHILVGDADGADKAVSGTLPASRIRTSSCTAWRITAGTIAETGPHASAWPRVVPKASTTTPSRIARWRLRPSMASCCGTARARAPAPEGRPRVESRKPSKDESVESADSLRHAQSHGPDVAEACITRMRATRAISLKVRSEAPEVADGERRIDLHTRTLARPECTNRGTAEGRSDLG